MSVTWKVFVLVALCGFSSCDAVVFAASSEMPGQELQAYVRQTIDEADSFEDRYDAEVWITLNLGRLEKFRANEKERVEILQYVHREATVRNIEPEIVLAIIDVESAFDRYALSVAGARGLMQVMPFWSEILNVPVTQLMDIETNIRIGCAIFRHYLDKENGDLVRALSRYNGTNDPRLYAYKVWDRYVTRWHK